VLVTIVQVADIVLDILSWAIIIRAILSWFPNAYHHPLVRTLNDFTDPLLRPFRRFQISGGGFGVDFSPLLALLAIILIRSLVLPLILSLSF